MQKSFPRFPQLSPVPDMPENEKSWAITQQQPILNRDRRISKRRHPEKSKSVGDNISGRANLPVLASLTMRIETKNILENQRKENSEELRMNRLMRLKKQKTLFGMYEAAKANKEVAQRLLQNHPSFNLQLSEHDLHKFLSPGRHIANTGDISTEDETEEEMCDDEDEQQQVNTVSKEREVETDMRDKEVETISKISLAKTTSHVMSTPPPLTNTDLIRRSKVIEAVTRSTLWKPSLSVSTQLPS